MSTRFIAVYGTLLSGEKNEWVAADAISRTPCMIPGKLYDTGYGYPAILAGGFDDVAEDKHR